MHQLTFTILLKNLALGTSSKLYVTDVEHLIFPFLNQFEYCHVHIITEAINLYFSHNLLRNTSWLTTLTIRNMATLDPNVTAVSNEPISLTTYEFGYNSFSLAVRDGTEDPKPKINPLNWKRNFVYCLIAIIFTKNSYQLRNYPTDYYKKPVIYFPYLTAIKELVTLFSVPEVLEFEPYLSKVVHVSIMPPTTRNVHLDLNYNNKLRFDLHLFTEYYHPVTWNMNFQKSNSNQFKIPILNSSSRISFFSTSCTAVRVKKRYESWHHTEMTGASISIKLNQINNISSECSHPSIWSLETNDYAMDSNLKDYQDLNNIFILPSTNKLVFRLAVISLILHITNSTLAPPLEEQNQYMWYRNHMFPKIYPERRYNQEYDYEFIFIPEILTHRFVSMPVRKFGYNFLTCYSYEYQSWKFYLEPFQMELWIALVVYLTIFAIFIHATLVLRNKNKSDFNAFIYAYSTMVEYAYGVPDYVFKVHTLKLLIGSWLLLSVIFTNAYKGIAITGVTSPHAKSSLRWFYDLLGDKMLSPETLSQNTDNKSLEFVIFPSLSNEMLNYWGNVSHDFEYRDDGNIILEETSYVPFYAENKKAFTKAFYDFALLVINKTFEYEKSRELKLIVELGKMSSYAIPARGNESKYSDNYLVALERQITNCTEKLLYVDDEKKIDREMDYLSRHYHYATFFKGNQSLFTDFVTWQFDNPRGSKLITIFRKFLENGIYHQLEWFYNRQDFSGLRLQFTRSNVNSKFEPVKGLDIYSNIQTIFYVYLCGILNTIFLFSVELFISFFVTSKSTYINRMSSSFAHVFLVLKLKIGLIDKIFVDHKNDTNIKQLIIFRRSYLEIVRHVFFRLIKMCKKRIK